MIKICWSNHNCTNHYHKCPQCHNPVHLVKQKRCNNCHVEFDWGLNV